MSKASAPTPNEAGPPPPYSPTAVPPYPAAGVQQAPVQNAAQPVSPANPQAAGTTQVTVVVAGSQGTCPHCRTGYRIEKYTCCGICLAIVFFPIGILCCYLMRQYKCSHCGRPM